MALSPAQQVTLKTDIAAAFPAVPNTDDGASAIADAYNQPASPAFTVWRTAVSSAECRQAMVWTEFIARSTGERDAWQFMLASGAISAADPNIRQGIADVFSGAGGAASRNALLAVAKRAATRAEKLFATGTGSVATPGTLAFEGNLSYQDVLAARSS